LYVCFDTELDPTKNHSYLIKKYKNGFSRYIENNGQISWKECEILSYDSNNMLFNIKWKHSGIEKQVKRLNLVYGKDNVDKFEDRLV